MFLSHFKFTRPPFRSAARPCGSFFAAYHQDVFGMLAEKSTVPGIVALFGDAGSLVLNGNADGGVTATLILPCQENSR